MTVSQDDKGFVHFTSQMDLCREFQVTQASVRSWINRGMPGESGKWKLADIIAWYAKTVAITKWKQLPKAERGEEENVGLQQLKELKLKQEIRDKDLAYAERIGDLIPFEHVRGFLERTSTRYREAGELLRKHHGDDAQSILLDAIEAVTKEWETAYMEGRNEKHLDG